MLLGWRFQLGPRSSFCPKMNVQEMILKIPLRDLKWGRNDKVKDFPMLLLAYVSLRFPTAGGYKCEK